MASRTQKKSSSPPVVQDLASTGTSPPMWPTAAFTFTKRGYFVGMKKEKKKKKKKRKRKNKREQKCMKKKFFFLSKRRKLNGTRGRE
jgi:hypothetical protein